VPRKRLRPARPPPKTADPSALWAAYWHHGGVLIGSVDNTEARNALVVHYLPSADRVAKNLQAHGVGRYFEQAEIASFAAFGLIRGVTRYNPATLDSQGRPVSFEVYVWRTMVHAVHDELRQAGRRTRGDISIWRRVLAAKASLAHEGAPESEANMADALGVSVARLRKMLVVAAGVALGAPVPWSAPNDRKGRGPPSGRSIEAVFPDPCPEPSEVAERANQASRLRAAVRKLPRREAQVVERIDFGHETGRAIAGEWGLTESRISQIRTQALAHLRRLLGD